MNESKDHWTLQWMGFFTCKARHRCFWGPQNDAPIFGSKIFVDLLTVSPCKIYIPHKYLKSRPMWITQKIKKNPIMKEVLEGEC